ncbi:MAG: NADH-quinone oxidoreductase subunit J [Deltaproteobacteria bacterium]|jgi:NADH-quinone oxidoreductase subunit J
MNIYAVIFYILGVLIVAFTVMAITRRNLMHAIVFLVGSFIATAVLFYLLGAPFLAIMEVVIYAGAIMVLFLFIVMMLEIEPEERDWWAGLRPWLWPLSLMGISLAVIFVYLIFASGSSHTLPMVMASPLAFGRFLFEKYWLGVEIASYLLFVALVGALYLGRGEETGG